MPRFKIDWVLVNELSIGPAPTAERHLSRLKDNGIKSILSLCSIDEAPELENMTKDFECSRLVLPDHRSSRKLEVNELLLAVEKLAKLKTFGPVYVHCFAGVERSPIVCMTWLVKEHGLTPQRALDYLMQTHPGTNPLPAQFEILSSLSLKKNN